MTFPTLVPSSRQFGSGDFPVSSYKSTSGVEVRILRGSRRTGATLQLTYNALSDTEVDLFLAHYETTRGTYESFTMTTGALQGYGGTTSNIDAGTDNEWRYSGPIQVQNVYPGVSNVNVSLVGVL